MKENAEKIKEVTEMAKENPIMGVEEMAAEIHKEQREGTHQALRKYRDKNGDIVPEEKIGTDIAVAREALVRIRERGTVDFWNIEEVIVRTEQYFEACERSGTFPSLMGLCAKGFGTYRERLDKFIATHPDTPTAEYIGIVKELMADILTNASLRNKANVAQTIFQLKNHFGHSDEVKVVKTVQEDPLTMGTRSEKEILERYRQSVVWDD